MAPTEPVPGRLAVCREGLDDGHEWSPYFLNELSGPVDLVVERVDYEWGDFGHAEAEGERVSVAPRTGARFWRVDGDAAELSCSSPSWSRASSIGAG